MSITLIRSPRMHGLPPHMIRVDGNPLLLLVHSSHPDLLQTLQGGE